MEFVHLHVHSHHSVEDGVAGVRDLVRAAREQGQTALALTDLHTLAGVPAFCMACREFNVRPVIGCEFNVASHDTKVAAEAPYRLVLLAENESGYRSLIALVNRAHLNARRQVPLLRPDDLQRHAAGLVALAGGPSSELYHLLQQGKLDETEACVARLARIYGRDNLVFMIQDHGLPRQRQINDRVHSLAEFLGVRCVATNAVCYVRPEDSICYDFLVQERPPSYVNFEEARNPARTRHLASAAEMLARFRKFPKAIFTTAEIADRCSFMPNFDRRRFPEHDFVRGFDADSYLWDLTFREARERLLELTPEMKARLNEEFDYIKTHGLSNSILLLWNVAQFCRRSRISMGVGTKNMISSLVAYILGITRVNPLDYKLRFLGFSDDDDHNLNLCVEIPPRHARALQAFLKETFGEEFCSGIGRPVWTRRPHLAREIRSWFNSPGLRAGLEADEEAAGGSSLPEDAPLEAFFPGQEVGVALPCPEILQFMLARLLPRPRDLTVEENEFAVSGESLNHITPRVPVDGEPVTQFDVASLDQFHVPRLTIVANRVLNVLDMASACVRQEENPTFDLDAIPMDDPETYDLLGRGLTSGIAPFHSVTLKSLLRTHRPRNFTNLVKVKGMERVSDGEREPDVRDHVAECLLTYRCAFIKTHYPVSFMAAVLSQACLTAGRDRRRFTILLREARRMGIRILPPDVNLSVFEFSHVQKGIRTGLMVVGGMGEKAYAELERVRRGGDFHDLMDLIQRTDGELITNRILSNLVRTGALDCFGHKRSQMLKLIAEHADEARRGGVVSGYFEESADRGRVPVVELPAVEEFSADELIRQEILGAGYSISQDEMDLYRDSIRQCRAVAPGSLTARMVGHEVSIAGFIDHMETDSPLLEDKEQLLLDVEGQVVTLSLKAARLYEAALHAREPVLLGGTVARRRDEIYLKAVTVFTLRMVREMSERVTAVELDLTGENSRTLRLIARLARQHRGAGTAVRIHHFRGGALDRWNLLRLRSGSVFFSPPFYYALKKILPEERIRIVAQEGTDPALLHALSPQRFPLSQLAVAPEPAEVAQAFQPAHREGGSAD